MIRSYYFDFWDVYVNSGYLTALGRFGRRGPPSEFWNSLVLNYLSWTLKDVQGWLRQLGLRGGWCGQGGSASLSSRCNESFGVPSLGSRILRIPLVWGPAIFKNLFSLIIVIVLVKHKIIANFQTFSP